MTARRVTVWTVGCECIDQYKATHVIPRHHIILNRLSLPPPPCLLLPSTTDWVEDNSPTGTVYKKWGDIGDWDVSGVKDFSFAFSKHRNILGEPTTNGNPKAVSFIGTGISKWITTSCTMWVHARGGVHGMGHFVHFFHLEVIRVARDDM